MPAEPSESLPPVGVLPWDHAERGGWRSWPAKCHLLARDTECPTCDGEGFVVRNGMAATCERCEGKGKGVFPGVQALAGVHIDAAYDSLIRSQVGACEYRVTRAVRSSYRLPVNPRYKDSGRTLKPTEMVFVQFRFAGGDGLLMPLTYAESRLVKGGA